MAPRNRRGATVHPVSAAQIERVTRLLDRVVQTLDAHISMIQENRTELLTQFQRIAQLQAEVDRLKQMVAKLTDSANG